MVVDPFWGGGKEEAQQKNELYGEEWSVGGNGGGGGDRQLAVRGGCTRWRGARGVVESVVERLEWAVHGGSVAAGMAAQWGVKGGGGRKGSPWWGWAPFRAARCGGRRAAQR
jgi:hypothetical protein